MEMMKIAGSAVEDSLRCIATFFSGFHRISGGFNVAIQKRGVLRFTFRISIVLLISTVSIQVINQTTNTFMYLMTQLLEFRVAAR